MANASGSSESTQAGSPDWSDSAAFRHYFLALLKSLSDPVALVDPDGKIELLNSAFEELLCARLEKVRGEDFFSLCVPPNSTRGEIGKQRTWRGLLQIGENGQTLEAVVQHTVPLPGARPAMVVRLCPEAAHAETLQQTFQQTKLESLGVLSSGIVHDLNNILTGILGHVSFLRLSLPREVTDQESLAAIEDGARKAASMTQQVLEFARGEELVLGPVNLSRVVADSLKLLSASLPENIELCARGIEDPLHVIGDEGQLNQLILNLTLNARDALPCGGTIAVELGKREFKGEVHCAELGIEPGDFVLLSIKDTGEGIADDIRDKIFEPFFTTKADFGTGLGLATVQAIVKAHRGVLSLHTAEGRGTCFEIALPSSNVVECLSDDGYEQPLPTGSEKILVVDDEETVRTIIQRSLEHLGYEVLVARNGLEALDAFTGSQDEFSLVIIDMIMPKMPGDELFYRLRELDRSVSVLVASGYASDSRTKAILADGALGFLQKPFAVEELAVEVRRCLDRPRSEVGEAA